MTLLAVLVNCPDAATAEAIAEALIDARLVASANLYPPIRSRYRWQGRIERAEEYPLLLKTRPELGDAVEAEIARRHPYEVPAILRLGMAANAAYRDWIGAETADAPGPA